MTDKCPCHSGKAYSDCCALLHKGEPAKTALLLMRSRYAAYAKNLPTYIIATTHPKSPHFQKNLNLWEEEISKFSQSFSFDNLTILDFKESGSKASITFTAFLTCNGKDCSFTEKSTFEKINGKWLYKEGLIISAKD